MLKHDLEESNGSKTSSESIHAANSFSWQSLPSAKNTHKLSEYVYKVFKNEQLVFFEL
jgi:hypothetical protein